MHVFYTPKLFVNFKISITHSSLIYTSHQKMILKIVLSLIVLFTTVSAFERKNHSISTDQAINSLLVVYQNLSSAQQRKVDKIIGESVVNGTQNNTSLTGKIDSFVNGLKKSVQVRISLND